MLRDSIQQYIYCTITNIISLYFQFTASKFRISLCDMVKLGDGDYVSNHRQMKMSRVVRQRE